MWLYQLRKTKPAFREVILSYVGTKTNKQDAICSLPTLLPPSSVFPRRAFSKPKTMIDPQNLRSLFRLYTSAFRRVTKMKVVSQLL
jgi:hypothetical protein